jgi:hypothetical protein
MKSLLLSLAALATLSLTGCAAYVGDPYYGAYGAPGYGYGYGYAAPSVSIGVVGDGYGHHDGRGWRGGYGEGRHWR